MKVTRRKRKPVRIEMLPLIDIVFLLLIFFIYAMLSMAVHRGLHLDLPESSSATVSRKSPVTISIKQSGNSIRVFYDKKEVGFDTLRSLLNKRRQGKNDLPVLVFADERVSYQQLFEVLDLLRESGIREISLQANRE